MPTFSIIVPIYDIEKYLDMCIKSILEQSYTDYELILVDDGSPDRCGEIIDRYAKDDKRIKVISRASFRRSVSCGYLIYEGAHVASTIIVPLFEGGLDLSSSSEFSLLSELRIIISLISPKISGVSLFLKYTINDGLTDQTEAFHHCIPYNHRKFEDMLFIVFAVQLVHRKKRIQPV